MSFLRENVFMVLLTTGTIVLCLVMLLWSGSISDQIDQEEISKRQNIASTIEKLDRPPYANGKTNNAEQNRVEGIRESLQNVGNENIVWNSRNFTVPQLTMLDGKQQPAFPLDVKVWERDQLGSRFVAKYHEQLDALRETLKPTIPPTPAEIAEGAEQQQKLINRQLRIEEKKTGKTSTKTTAARTAYPVGPDEMPPDLMEPGMSISRQGRVGSKTGAGSDAETRARDILRIEKAQKGRIYVDDTPSPFDLVFPKGLSLISEVDPEKFWDAQLGFWVQSGIVGAIKDTIQTAQDQQKIPEKQRNVINSPIKRLIKITVGEDSTSRKKTSSKAVPSGYQMEYPDWGPEGPGMPSRMPAHSAGSGRRNTRTTAGTTTAGEKPETLTQSAANKIYDVVNYSFTVLMPTRHLPLLQESLLKRNYHVILNVQIEQPDEESSSQKNSTGDTQGLYYYGTEPVRKVTIDGQLLLVTGFTRGMWDSEKQEWLHKSLMPLEVMKKLDASAQRSEDKLLIEGRLLQSGKPPAPVVTTPTRGQPARPGGTQRGSRRIVLPDYMKKR